MEELHDHFFKHDTTSVPLFNFCKDNKDIQSKIIHYLCPRNAKSCFTDLNDFIYLKYEQNRTYQNVKNVLQKKLIGEIVKLIQNQRKYSVAVIVCLENNESYGVMHVSKLFPRDFGIIINNRNDNDHFDEIEFLCDNKRYKCYKNLS